MITNYDLIVFDWDGTLVDSIDWIVDCIQRVAVDQDLTQPSKQNCKDVIGLSLSNAMLTLFPEITDDEKALMVDVYRTLYLAKETTVNDLFADSLYVLQELQKRNKILAVATGKGQTGLDRGLDGTGTRSFFEHLRCAETMESKPSPHMLFDIMQESGVKAEKMLMIGDSTLDLIMAKKAGVASVGITTGAHSRETLTQHEPIACINNLMELFKR